MRAFLTWELRTLSPSRRLRCESPNQADLLCRHRYRPCPTPATTPPGHGTDRRTYHAMTSWMKCSSFFSPLQVAQVLFPLPEHVLHLRGAPMVTDSRGIPVAPGPSPNILPPRGGLWWARSASTCPPSRPPASHSSAPTSYWSPPFSPTPQRLHSSRACPIPPVTSLGPQPGQPVHSTSLATGLIQRLTHEPGGCVEIYPRTFVGTLRKGSCFPTEVAELGAGGGPLCHRRR